MTQIGCEKRVKRKLVFYEQMYLLNREEKTFVTCWEVKLKYLVSVFLSLSVISFYDSSANTVHWPEARIQQTSHKDCSVHVSVIYG